MIPQMPQNPQEKEMLQLRAAALKAAQAGINAPGRNNNGIQGPQAPTPWNVPQPIPQEPPPPGPRGPHGGRDGMPPQGPRGPQGNPQSGRPMQQPVQPAMPLVPVPQQPMQPPMPNPMAVQSFKMEQGANPYRGRRPQNTQRPTTPLRRGF